MKKTIMIVALGLIFAISTFLGVTITASEDNGESTEKMVEIGDKKVPENDYENLTKRTSDLASLLNEKLKKEKFSLTTIQIDVENFPNQTIHLKSNDKSVSDDDKQDIKNQINKVINSTNDFESDETFEILINKKEEQIEVVD
ncbi:hypothetical protein [Virgibacillus salexigens]|uniref:hypothetical protein n=1 Tax=Virgibacillus salexigens TaxID=61016 RepID=UPI003081E5B8